MNDQPLEMNYESANLEFKASFDPNRPGDWLEIIKDIVAMANSGGGMILLGVKDDGAPSGADVSAAVGLDLADVTNRIYKYTNNQFHGLEISGCRRSGAEICAISVRASRIPMVFTKVGAYEYEPGKQKTAFSQGTVYFRHGAKSEPCNSEDLREFVEREVEAVRHTWMDGIAKIIEAPTGSRIAVLPPEALSVSPAGALAMRLTNDQNAHPYYAVPIDSTHPFRQKEVVQEVNALLAGRRSINARDILCIRRVHNIQKDIELCYTQNYASPRYSQAFVDWIVKQYELDAHFFEKAKTRYDQARCSVNGTDQVAPSKSGDADAQPSLAS